MLGHKVFFVMNSSICGQFSVSTATMIVHRSYDRYAVLTALNPPKHGSGRLLPGGKMDKIDEIDTDTSSPESQAVISQLHLASLDAAEQHAALVAVHTAIREIQEEIGIVITPNQLTLIGKCLDPLRDVRTVPFRKIKDSVYQPSNLESLPDDEELVTVSYGCPDYIWEVCYDGSLPYSQTEELMDIRFDPFRGTASYGAGHGTILREYFKMVARSGATFEPYEILSFGAKQ